MYSYLLYTYITYRTLMKVRPVLDFIILGTKFFSDTASFLYAIKNKSVVKKDDSKWVFVEHKEEIEMELI